MRRDTAPRGIPQWGRVEAWGGGRRPRRLLGGPKDPSWGSGARPPASFPSGDPVSSLCRLLAPTSRVLSVPLSRPQGPMLPLRCLRRPGNALPAPAPSAALPAVGSRGPVSSQRPFPADVRGTLAPPGSRRSRSWATPASCLLLTSRFYGTTEEQPSAEKFGGQKGKTNFKRETGRPRCWAAPRVPDPGRGRGGPVLG